MKGAQGNDPNKGGTWRWEDIKVSLTDANHSSSSDGSNISASLAASMFKLEDGKHIYFAGDTNAFGDGRSSGGSCEPEIAVLPISDHYTMGPKEAAVASSCSG